MLVVRCFRCFQKHQIEEIDSFFICSQVPFVETILNIFNTGPELRDRRLLSNGNHKASYIYQGLASTPSIEFMSAAAKWPTFWGK